ncbi:MAG: Holliday junction resolvase RuvX [Alphaproteobacteria bacterium]|nr:Holliday junction resolvase RuvX [Alphaproteobacteria bacterium]
MAKNKKIRLLEECRDDLPRNVRLMGLDLGVKTIGVAVSDAAQSIATPVTTIKRTKFSQDAVELGKHIRDLEVGGYILGWPLNMDGSRGTRCDAVLSFADEMTRYPEIFGKQPFIALWDERLSTQTVDKFLDKRVDIGKKAKKGAKGSGLVDRLAAQVILQGALENLT